MTRRWQGEKINKIEKFLPQVSGETSIYVGPKNIIRTAVSDMISDVMWNPWVAEDLRYAMEFFAQDTKAQSAMVASGSTKYYKPENLQDAIIVQSSTTAAFVEALTAAAAITSGATRFKYVLVDQDTPLDYPVRIPEDVHVISRNRSRFYRPAGVTNAYITATSRCALVGFGTLDLHIQYASETAVDTAQIIGIEMKGNPMPGITAYIRDVGTNDNTVHNRGLIALCDAGEAAYFFYRTCTQNFKCIANRQLGTYNISRMFLSHGGWGNEDAYNYMYGGIVGHGVLLDRRFSRGWYNNYVHNNWFSMISEEGISIDIQGNGFRREDPSNPQSPIVEWYQGIIDHVQIIGFSGSMTGSNGSLILAKPDLAGVVTNNHALLITTGALSGKYLRFNFTAPQVAGVSSRFQLRSRSLRHTELTSLVGQYVAIVCRADGNTYDSNTTEDVRDHFKWWGAGWHNTITRNKVVKTMESLPPVTPGGPRVVVRTQEISLTHVCGLNTMHQTAAGNACCGPSHNLIAYNDADVGFSGQSYGSQSNTEQRMDAFPNTVVGNKKYIGIAKTFNRDGNWTSDKVFHNVEVLSTEWRPEFARGAYNQSASVNPTTGKFSRQVTISLVPGTLTYSIPHGLPAGPTNYVVKAGNAHALQQFTRTIIAPVTGGAGGSVEIQIKEENPFSYSADAANINITYVSAPAAGNAIFHCEASV